MSGLHAELFGYNSNIPLRIFYSCMDAHPQHYRELSLIFLLCGKAEIETRTGRHTWNKGELKIFNPMEKWRILSKSDDAVCLRIHIDIDSFYSLWPELFGQCFALDVCNIGSKDTRRVYYIFAQIVHLSIKRTPGFRVNINLLLNQLVMLLNESFSMRDFILGAGDKDDLAFFSLLTHIEENYNKEWSLDSLAKIAHMNPQYLSRYFNKKLGVTVSRYYASLRVRHSLPDVIKGDGTIVEIAYRHGFKNISNYYKLFHEIVGMTPNEYKHSFKDKPAVSFPETEVLTESIRDMLENAQPELSPAKINGESSREYRIDVRHKPTPLHKNWRGIIGFRDVFENRDYEWRRQFGAMQNELSFEYALCHNIFGESMKTIRRDVSGKKVYNFKFLDDYIDFLYAQKLKPFIELSPPNSDKPSVFYDNNEWQRLIAKLMSHLTQKYGKEELGTWLFGLLFAAPRKHVQRALGQFFELFIRTRSLVKGTNSNIKLGVCGFREKDISFGRTYEFFKGAAKNATPPDFLAMDLFLSEPESINSPSATQPSGESTSQSQQKSLVFKVERVVKFLQAHGLCDTKLIVTSIGITPCEYPLNDTYIMPSFLIKTLLSLTEPAAKTGYGKFSDILNEQVSMELFHGGAGLMAANGIPKASFNAYFLLNKLGDYVISKGDMYIFTGSSDGKMQLLIYNYNDISNLYTDSNTIGNNFDKNNRYNCLKYHGQAIINFDISGIKGIFRIKTTSLAKNSGSIYDAYVRMGCDESEIFSNLDKIAEKSTPEYNIKTVTYDGTAKISVILDDYEVKLMEIIPFRP